MASVASVPANRIERRAWWRRMHPAEGWLLVLLHIAIVLIATWSIQAAGWSDQGENLPLIAIGATAFGFALAKSPVIDLLAHLLAFWTGVAVVWVITAATFAEPDSGWRGGLAAIAERLRAWIQLSAQGEPANDRVLFAGLLALSVWLVAYMSAWTLYRRQWVVAAVGLPSVVTLCNAGYSNRIGAWPLAALLLAAVMLTAAHFHHRRRMAWSADEAMWSSAVPWRSAAMAVQIGLLALIGAWVAPDGTRQQVLDHIGQQLERPLDRIDGWGNELFSRFGSEGSPRAMSYAQFSDSFELGGALDLSDDPMVVLDADGSAYLAAYRYDRWDGTGWESAVERTFSGRNADGKRYSPQMRFAPNQPVALSDAVTTNRAPVTGEVTLIEADNSLLLTLDTFQEAEVPTTVQLSWRTLDNASLAIDDPGTLPPDLRRLAMLLSDANAAGFASGGGTPLTAEGALNESLLAERSQLRERLITVDWKLVAGRLVEAIIVSGQLPIYDDVEAVFARDDPEGTTYDVTGLTSLATADELRSAGQDYPAFVQDRYLQQSPTTTARTRDLAAAIVEQAGAANPFDQAVAIQNDLRTRIRYEEQIEAPPDDQDVVDFVLFESREGYCEYYASSMAVMLRALGIPSRIAVGYYPAAYDETYAGYLYRQRNAHAWVEAYFPAFGWIPFEPTASQPVREYGDTRTSDPPLAPSPMPELPNTPTAEVIPTQTPAVMPPVAVVDDTGGDWRATLAMWARWGTLFVAIVLLCAAALVWFLWNRGLRALAATDGPWARVMKAGRWAGVRAEPSMTPLEYADEIGRVVPQARRPANQVASDYTLRRYGALGKAADAGTANQAWRELRQALTRGWARRKLLRRP